MAAEGAPTEAQPTLRDQFAMSVVTGLVGVIWPQMKVGEGEMYRELISGAAYQFADAMMKARQE